MEMGLSGVFGRSTASWRLLDGWRLPCDARGEGIEPGRVDGAVMLREDECARMASAGSSPSGREAQHPWKRVRLWMKLVLSRGMSRGHGRGCLRTIVKATPQPR
jgi:hypothetical protein